jgi:hypothetical protein
MKFMIPISQVIDDANAPQNASQSVPDHVAMLGNLINFRVSTLSVKTKLRCDRESVAVEGR